MAEKPIKARRKKLRDYKLDPANPNAGTPQGTAMLEHSVETFGPARSGVADQDGVIRAGNHTAEQLFAVGIENVIEVEAGPDEWVVVKRPDMDATMGKEYAVADNRTGQLISFDPKIMAELDGEINLTPYFDAQTLAKFHEKAGSSARPKPEFEITAELFERQDYLVIVTDNELDWQVLCDKLGVTTVLDVNMAGRTIPKQGVGRVIPARRLLELLRGTDES